MTHTRSSAEHKAQLQLAGSISHTSCCWSIGRPLTIGRESADIQLPIISLSRQHARVSPTPAGYEIIDLASRNGTAVNGNLLSDDQPCALHHGDTIVLAGQVELIFKDPNATPSLPRLGAVRGLWIDPLTEDIWVDARCLSPALSRKQYELLSLVSKAEGRIVERDEIIRHLWPETAHEGVSNDAIDSLTKRLRRRLSELENGRPIMEQVRGRGLRLVRKRDALPVC